jgi:flagella basal body P-ring formation protein FlgA
MLVLSMSVHIVEGTGVLSEERVSDKMKSAIREYVSERLQKDPIRINIKTVTPILTGKIKFENDQVAVTQGPVGEGGKGLMGRSLFLLSVKQKNGTVSDHWVTADVSVVRKVLVATRPIQRKELIESNALVVLTVHQVRPDELYVETMDDLVNKKAQRLILPGVPITFDMIEDAPVMSKGDRVILFVETEGVTVSVSGRVKEDGFLGRQVAVVPQDSQKPIYGTVVSASKVQVAF